MRHFNALQKGAFVLAGVMIVGGGLMALFPDELVHTYPAAVSEAGVNFPEWTDHLCRSGARICGILAAASRLMLT